jgi:hypothetical protein
VSFDTQKRAKIFVPPEGTEPKAGLTRKPPTDLGSDAERIAAHRRHDIAFMIQNNTCPPYGSLHDSDFWTDFAGAESSAYDASTLRTLLDILGVDMPMGAYDRKTGTWIGKDRASISIETVRSVLDDRIKALGVSKLKLWEYIDSRPDFDEAREFRKLSFEQRMNRFREGSTQ